MFALVQVFQSTENISCELTKFSNSAKLCGVIWVQDVCQSATNLETCMHATILANAGRIVSTPLIHAYIRACFLLFLPCGVNATPVNTHIAMPVQGSHTVAERETEVQRLWVGPVNMHPASERLGVVCGAIEARCPIFHMRSFRKPSSCMQNFV